MGFPVSEVYGLPMDANSLVGSVMANSSGSHYPLRMSIMELSNRRIKIDMAFSVPKRVRLPGLRCSTHDSTEMVERCPFLTF